MKRILSLIVTAGILTATAARPINSQRLRPGNRGEYVAVRACQRRRNRDTRRERGDIATPWTGYGPDTRLDERWWRRSKA